MEFYLGTDEPSWLKRTEVPLFVSRRRILRLKRFPRATCDWALDSGGFTELKLFGRWTLAPREYVSNVRRFIEEIGRMRWAAIQDWMCEDVMLRKTGKTIAEHQRLTIENYSELRYLAPDVPWIPVLQGYRIRDYLDHIEMYARAGDYLQDLPLVGVGSVCRRQNTLEAAALLKALHAEGLRLHGFGLKTDGVRRSAQYLASSDSQSWSKQAFHQKRRLDGCTHKERYCVHCMRWAMVWRGRVLESIDGALGRYDRDPRRNQRSLFEEVS